MTIRLPNNRTVTPEEYEAMRPNTLWRFGLALLLALALGAGVGAVAGHALWGQPDPLEGLHAYIVEDLQHINDAGALPATLVLMDSYPALVYEVRADGVCVLSVTFEVDGEHYFTPLGPAYPCGAGAS